MTSEQFGFAIKMFRKNADFSLADLSESTGEYWQLIERMEGGHMELEQESYEEFLNKMVATGEAKIERIQRAVEELKGCLK